MMEIINSLANDGRIRTLFGLIVLDVLFGVAEAIKLGVFDWKRLAEFYKTMILPMLIGYGAVVIITPLVVSDLLGEYSDLMTTVLTTVGWAVLVAQLVTSIKRHAGAIWGDVFS